MSMPSVDSQLPSSEAGEPSARRSPLRFARIVVLALVVLSGVLGQWAIRSLMNSGYHECEVTAESLKSVPDELVWTDTPQVGSIYDGRESWGCTRPEVCWGYRATLFTTRRVHCDPYVAYEG